MPQKSEESAEAERTQGHSRTKKKTKTKNRKQYPKTKACRMGMTWRQVDKVITEGNSKWTLREPIARAVVPRKAEEGPSLVQGQPEQQQDRVSEQ